MTFAANIMSHLTTPQILEILLRILVACVVGAGIGLERISHSKSVGPYTHAMTCFAAAMIMIVSKYGFADLSIGEAMFPGTRGADASRMAAQAISGISFLCAGLIFKNGSNVRGLTTAAGMWLTLTLGLCIGAGMYFVAGFGILILFMLHFFFRTMRIGYVVHSVHMSFTVQGDDKAFKQALDKQLAEWQAKEVTDKDVVWNPDGTVVFEFTIHSRMVLGFEELKSFIEANPMIKSASATPQ